MDSYNIVVKNIEKQYGNFNLNISLNLPKGQIVGLIGENGAGKSTFIKLILDLIQKKSGSISIFEIKNLNKNREILEDIGVVLDEEVLPENLNADKVNSIMKNIYKTWDSNLYNLLLKKLNLPSDKKIKSFSKGMKMKMSLIVAMSHNPKILILDEPTTGLDPIVREEILDLFLDFVQDENRSILFSSHIMEDLERIADRIIFIANGHIKFDELKDDLIYDWAIIRCPKEEFLNIDKNDILAYRDNYHNYDILVKDKQQIKKKYPNLLVDNILLSDIMSIFIKGIEGGK